MHIENLNTMLKTSLKWIAGVAFFISASMSGHTAAFNPAQQPLATDGVPGNLLFALSVEWPTGIQASYINRIYSFSPTISARYQGYFDNRKCYTYNATLEVFQPDSALNATNGSCSTNTQWSGDVLNWLTMSNLDQFRSVMTGGTRDTFSSMAAASPGDTLTNTILIRAASDRYYDPDPLTPNVGFSIYKKLPSVGVPGTLQNKYVRYGGNGSKFLLTNSTVEATALGVLATIANTQIAIADQLKSCATSPSYSGISNCFNIRVEVCKSVTGVGQEANCNQSYSATAGKPEGLLQAYANKLRYGAFGYLKYDSPYEDAAASRGGVLRSAMKSIGSVAATGATTVANSNAEWNSTTGVIYANPDSADATASAVSNSGLINYINKFGYATGYRGVDPVSELYYAAQLYLRGKTPPASYSTIPSRAASTAASSVIKDGFPVITGTDLIAGGTRDPIIQSCQKNFILGIGDIYGSCDSYLPGSTTPGDLRIAKAPNYIDVPALATDISSTTCVGSNPTDTGGPNVSNLWTTIKGLEGITNWSGGSYLGSPYIASLAYWGNTNDIRTDLTGTQTISTYWVDVLEKNNRAASAAAAGLVKSQNWLAAKYGGFDTLNNTISNPNTVTRSWDADGNGVPDTWFGASDPTRIRQGLTDAFSKIGAASEGGAGGAAASSSPLQTSSSFTFYSGYDPKTWSGSVRACLPSQTSAQCIASPQWDASGWFNTTLTPTYVTTPLTSNSRKIFTSSRVSATSFTKSNFSWANLSTAQQAILNSNDSRGQERTDYLRGSRANEGAVFRTRQGSVLGDIVNSGVRYLGSSEANYSGVNFNGHAAYRAINKSRAPVVYAGANDGMLHAFKATTGEELFAYIPGSVFANLPSLSVSPLSHKYFVDSTPMVGDVQDGSTWKTVLSGGLGGGGKGYYALDITSQNSFSNTTSATISQLPLWEFTDSQDADLGFTFNEPSIDPVTGANLQIAKVASSSAATGEWRTIVGNGYGSTAGKSVLFMLDSLTGTPIKLTADNGPDNGLSTPTPFDLDRDGLIDTIYAGDLKGKVHKFQFSKADGTNYIVARSGDTAAQWRYIGFVYDSGKPITTAPTVARSCDGIGLIVAFGTGKLNEQVDYTSISEQSFYSIKDIKPSSSLAVGVSDLGSITFTTTDVSGNAVRNFTTPNLSGKSGWYVNFTGGERVLSNSTLPPDTGGVLFGTTKPSSDSCTPGNTGFNMLLDLCSGRPTGLLFNGLVYGGVSTGPLGDGLNKISNTVTNSQGKQVVVGNKGATGLTIAPQSAPRARYSWRQILTR